MNKFLLYISLFFSISLFSQNIEFRGIVLDSLQEPMMGANVLLKDINKIEKIQFKMSDTKGVFLFSVKPETTYEIKLSYIGYETIQEHIEVGQNKVYKTFSFTQTLEQLKEVVIESKPDIIYKKDTVVYNPNAFLKGTERNVEDLLKQLPGIDVDQEGTIKIGGREIEKILIDNDDFLGKRYKLISKNMQIKVIDSIQVLSNYQDNHLLKGIINDEKVAINIQLKEEYKQIWFGNLDIGLDILGEDFHAVKFNTMKMGGKLKHYFIGDFNNIGKSANNSKIIIDNASGASSVFNIANSEDVFNFNTPSGFNLNINSNRYNNNKQKLGNYSNIYSFSKQTKLTTNLTGQWDKKQYFNEDYTSYQSGLDFTNTRSQDLLSKAFSGEIKIKLESYLSKKESLLIEANYQRNSVDANRFNILNEKQIHEKYDNTKQRLDILSSYLNKLSSSSLWTMNTRFIDISMPEIYDVDAFLYPSLFPNAVGDKVQQDLHSKMQLFAWNSNYVFNQTQELSYSISTGFLQRQDQLNSQVFISPLDNTSSWSSTLNNQEFIKNEMYLSGNIKYRLQKFRFSVGLKAQHLITSLQELTLTKEKKNNSYLQPNLNVTYRFKEKQSIDLSYSKSYHTTDAYMLNRNPIIVGLQSLTKGFSEFKHLSSDSYSLRYSYGKWTDAFNLNSSLSYELDHDYFSNKIYIEQDYSYMEQVLARNQKRLRASTEINQYIAPIHSNLKLSLNYFTQEYQRELNSNISEGVKMKSWYADLELKSALKGFFNYELQANYFHSESKTTSRFSVDFLKASANLYFNLNPKLSLSSFLETYHFFDSNIRSTNFVDFNLNYKTKLFSKDFHFILEGRNLLNNKEFYRSNITDISISNESYRLLPRMLLLNVSWSF